MSDICVSYDGEATCVPTEMFWAVAVIECMMLICAILFGVSIWGWVKGKIHRILKRKTI